MICKKQRIDEKVLFFVAKSCKKMQKTHENQCLFA